VEVRLPDGALVVLDCGTGAHDLGRALLADARGPVNGHLLITHTHWDHIQGFPFFAPLFVKGSAWDLYAPGGLGQQLEHTLAGQMEYTYFPVTLGQLAGTTRYHDLVEGAFDIGGARVTTHYLNHPALTLGYRLEAAGVTLVYVTDHEPHSPFLSEALRDGPDGRLVHQEDQHQLDFIAGADLLIHDAQYTASEYEGKHGWGHTPAEWAVDMAAAAGVRRLALFHHDPTRTDEALDALVRACREHGRVIAPALDVFAAAEGQLIDLTAPPGTSVLELGASSEEMADATATPSGPTRAKTVLIADDDRDVVELLSIALEGDEFRLLPAYDGTEALRIARQERPDLILLDWRMPAPDGLAVTRELRADPDPALRDVPIVVLTSNVGADETAAAFDAGVTDYLTKPFTTANILTRIRGWLLRAQGAGSV
jgi:CheY-like chemotaxis protein